MYDAASPIKVVAEGRGGAPDKMAAIHISGMSQGAAGTSEGFSRFLLPFLKRTAAHYRWPQLIQSSAAVAACLEY